jgi:hypothetical protein
MIKLFAILTVLAALPVSALAEQVQISKSAGIHCTKDAADVPFVRSAADAQVVKSGDAAVAQ